MLAIKHLASVWCRCGVLRLQDSASPAKPAPDAAKPAEAEPVYEDMGTEEVARLWVWWWAPMWWWCAQSPFIPCAALKYLGLFCNPELFQPFEHIRPSSANLSRRLQWFARVLLLLEQLWAWTPTN